MFGRKRQEQEQVLDGEGEVMPTPPKRRRVDAEPPVEDVPYDVSGAEPQGRGPWKGLFRL